MNFRRAGINVLAPRSITALWAISCDPTLNSQFQRPNNFGAVREAQARKGTKLPAKSAEPARRHN
jgi:hypothetical protein